MPVCHQTANSEDIFQLSVNMENFYLLDTICKQDLLNKAYV